MRYLAALLLLTSLVRAEPKVERGEINGAQFRIDVPENWNGVLILFCHGYAVAPVRFDDPKLSPLLAGLVSEGNAVAQSGYVAGGWAVAEAIQDTEALRRYFITKHGKPKETYISGGSMGGHLTMAIIESFPSEYDGALALCGVLSPAYWFMERRVFDMRVVFDYYFPGALPSPVKVPADFTRSPERVAQLTKLLDGKPSEAAAMRRYSAIRTNRELAGTIEFWTYILMDLQQRGGGNPFDNRNTIYEGTDDDNAVNDSVARYTAEPRAAEYVRRYYTSTGHLTRPLLALHTTYDVLVPTWIPNYYGTLVKQGGSEDLFVQQYVKHDGHCAFQPEEITRGFAQLREWKTSGKRPPAGKGN